MGIKDYDGYMEQLQNGKNILIKFNENFFISKLMEDDQDKVKNFLGDNQEEEKKTQKYDENSEQNQLMSQSFYQKEGLDYLYW